MNKSQIVTYITIIVLIAFGIYRKNYTSEDPLDSYPIQSDPYRATTSKSTHVPGGTSRSSSDLQGKHKVARIAYQVEQKLSENESIIQVHDYSNQPARGGIEHTFDVTLFNSSTTQALTKRIQCLELGGSVEIVNTQLMSPITGSTMTSTDIVDDVSELLLDDAEPDEDVKFVRDKYAFVKKDILPPEPVPLGKECTRQINSGHIITNECQAQLNVYSRAMAEYQTQVEEVREKGTFTRRRLAFAPMNETVEEHKKYPLSQPQTFGFAAHEEAPIDYSSLELIKPLEKENFFNSVALEKSSLALQYG